MQGKYVWIVISLEIDTGFESIDGVYDNRAAANRHAARIPEGRYFRCNLLTSLPRILSESREDKCRKLNASARALQAAKDAANKAAESMVTSFA